MFSTFIIPFFMQKIIRISIIVSYEIVVVIFALFDQWGLFLVRINRSITFLHVANMQNNGSMNRKSLFKVLTHSTD